MNLINEYFIIESLLGKDIHDGEVFFKSLKSIKGRDPEYISVDNLDQFEKAMLRFSESNKRYLFISAHGDEEHIFFNNGKIHVDDLSIINIDLKKRRIFMSTCRGGTFFFGRLLIRKGAYSVIGSPDDLAQMVSVAMWTTMAVLFDRFESDKLNYEKLNFLLQNMVNIYEVNLSYFSFVRGKDKIKEYKYYFYKAKTKTNHPLR